MVAVLARDVWTVTSMITIFPHTVTSRCMDGDIDDIEVLLLVTIHFFHREMAMVLDFFVERYLGRLATLIEGDILKVLGVKNEIEKLQRRLERIKDFLRDAEYKRHRDAGINTWVRELKDVMYDADDILDLCMLNGGKLLELQASDSGVCFSLCMISSCFTCIKYRHEVASKIEQLNSRLEEIAQDRQNIIPRLHSSSVQEAKDRKAIPSETYSLEVKSDIVGTEIEDAAQSLSNQITVQKQKQECEIFGIVGMDGIGKTTLARKIFNDERIKDKFPLRIWLYVSKNYSDTDLLNNMIRDAGGNIEVGESKDRLLNKLVSLISKNLLLVLDDVWSPKVWWELIRDPIISGASDSKIIVTTRDQMVLTNMIANHIHQVGKMSQETGWALLSRTVFGNDKIEDEIGMLKDLGISLVKKCDGLPLAIKVIGGVLRSKERCRKEWEKALQSDLWEMQHIDKELPRALYLSYEDLPLHLKQCFLYCSLFSNVQLFPALAYHWMAEGFLVEQENKLIVDIAEDYYKELLWRNILQPDPIYIDQYKFSMHDLLRSLGVNLVQGEGCILKHGQTLNTNPLSKIRRLSMSWEEDILVLPDVIMKQKCLRSLIMFNSPQVKKLGNDVVQRLKLLRVLSMRKTSLEILPDSIGQLQHLRYLNLAQTNIQVIPESIGRLTNLQALILEGCKSLHMLPKATTKLHSLLVLSLFETPLTHMPKEIGRLKNLQTLTGFLIGHDDEYSSSKFRDEGCNLDELQLLSNMGTLTIERLERAVIINEPTTVLSNMPFLQNMELRWTKRFTSYINEDDNQTRIKAEKILDQLSPPSTLRHLTIDGFPGRQFPQWISQGGAIFPNLRFLKFENLPSCNELPSLLGQLPKLKFLWVDAAEAIQTIGHEFLQGPHGGSAGAFPKLESLMFLNMPNWEEWPMSSTEVEKVNVDDGGRNLLPKAENPSKLPNLKRCDLEDCPKLRTLPDCLRHATNLEVLVIKNNHTMREISDLPSLTDLLQVTNMTRLEKISNLPSLRRLRIHECSSLEYVDNLNTLQILVLSCSQHVEQLPKWLLVLIEQHHSTPFSTQQSFKEFWLDCSNTSLFNSCLKGGANWHIIQQIPDVKIRLNDRSKFILYTKDPQTCETNVDSEFSDSASLV